MQKLFEQKEFLFYWMLFLSIFVSRLPMVGKYFRLINTLIHEFGHALFALLSAGKVRTIELFSNTAGTTTTQSTSGFSRWITSMAGYPFSILAAYSSLYLISLNKESYLLFGILGITLFCLLFFIRNLYGIFWGLTFGLLLALVLYYGSFILTYGCAVFIAFIFLSEALISSFQLLIISCKTPKAAGDAKNLAELTAIPAPVWALLFVGFALWVLYKSIFSFFPNPF
ncbi:MAG: M50 family metallopeptidase [Bacteroidales bacterium]